ncbi:Agamous-like MADS-box protein AGL80 [Vitis vinifera]|uniref:Agamous-like MADS-box protein AGL80 n=1 Tax=Vitis vinifera TaxID=29760 RepID=A0A438F7J4_VITVI|nr:Agamous-like MADS-box protein AGL80 [Vitis vinifera]
MARKKVQLQWIMNDTTRRTTYKKRVKGLMKKAKELSILCGVEACAIVYSPYDPQPEVWPSPMEVVRVIGEFECRPENDQTKKRLNQENYIRQRVAKAKEQVDLNIKELSDLMWYIDDQLKPISHKMEYSHHPAPQPGGAVALTAVPVAQKTPLEVALESLENQILMDTAPQPRDGVVTVAHTEGQDMMLPVPHDNYEDPSFWGAPFFP